MRVYYYHPFEFHFRSAMTIQAIHDYVHLAAHGYEVIFYGTYEDSMAFQEVREVIGAARVRLLVRRGKLCRWRGALKARLLWMFWRDPSPQKLLVTRNFSKEAEVQRLLPLLGRGGRGCRTLMEIHEDGFPHLLPQKKGGDPAAIKVNHARILERCGGLVLTNYSQEGTLCTEFPRHPGYVVLPNGVDPERFASARAPEVKAEGPFVVTYTGQFVAWKNVELLFRSLALLDSRFHLRIAGGKGDAASDGYVAELTARYGLEGRVDYRGFVSPRRLVAEVLDGSSVLALPLGENLRSRLFTSPMKLFEAMATAIPVVAVDFPTVRGITGEDTVFLAAATDEGFARAIGAAVFSPERGERVARMNLLVRRYAHRERARRFHEWLVESGGCLHS
ncbi:MAG: glycosyltransferase family 4 protein [Magnetococcales bacterium]|nr:glycosyltransferase family 4 protein [Magnetococcales bacterium]